MVAKFAPDEVIVLPLMTLLMLPVAVPVEKKIVPRIALVSALLMVQFCTVLLEASAMNRIVDGVAADNVFSIFKVPNPLIVTLFAPLRLIRGPATDPEIVRVPLGVIVNEVQPPLFR